MLRSVSGTDSLNAMFPNITRTSQNHPHDVSTCSEEVGGATLDSLCCSG